MLLSGCPASLPEVDSASTAPELQQLLTALPSDAPLRVQHAFRDLVDRAARQPARPEPWIQLGLVCEANAYWVQAAEAFERACALALQEPLLALHQHHARWRVDPLCVGVSELQARAARHQRSAPWQQFVGDVLVERGEFQAARLRFESAAALAPGQAEPLVGRGECALEEELFEQARAHFEAALRIDPSYKAARYMLGVALQRCGREEDAKRELARGAGGRKRRMPDNLSRALDSLTLDLERVLCQASEWIDSGEPARAEELLQQHAANHPTDARLSVNLGVARLRRNEPAVALADFDTALALAPQSHFAAVNRAACLLELGRLDEALDAARAAVAAAPAAARAHLALASACAALGEHAEAARAAERAVELEPTSPAARHGLASACVALGDPTRALAHFEAQCDLLPFLWQTHAELARALTHVGEPARAQQALDKAFELAASEPRLRALARELGLESHR